MASPLELGFRKSKIKSNCRKKKLYGSAGDEQALKEQKANTLFQHLLNAAGTWRYFWEKPKSPKEPPQRQSPYRVAHPPSPSHRQAYH